MIVDPGAGIGRGSPRSIRIPVGRDDVASARVRVRAVESQVDGLRPGAVRVSRRNIDVELIERVCAVVETCLSGPESTGGCAPAQEERQCKGNQAYPQCPDSRMGTRCAE